MNRKVITLFAAVALLASLAVSCGEKDGPDIPGGGAPEIAGGFDATGASNSLFSVSPKKQVRFSRGNLQYHCTFDAWRFAENQYDCLLDSNNAIAPDYMGWIDLFGWGTSSWDGGAIAYMPYSVDKTDTNYWAGGEYSNGLVDDFADADWGYHNPIHNGGNVPKQWRTLSRDEWRYLFGDSESRDGKWAFAKIDGKHRGVVLLPDKWTAPEGVNLQRGYADSTSLENILSANDWGKLEAAGAIFLPSASQRSGALTDNVTTGRGAYWSTSYRNKVVAYCLYFNVDAGSNPLDANYYQYGRSAGLAVRLVKDNAATK